MYVRLISLLHYFRKFLYENLPQLKYHNPSMEFTVKRHRGKDSRIELLSGRHCTLLNVTVECEQKEQAVRTLGVDACYCCSMHAVVA